MIGERRGEQRGRNVMDSMYGVKCPYRICKGLGRAIWQLEFASPHEGPLDSDHVTFIPERCGDKSSTRKSIVIR